MISPATAKPPAQFLALGVDDGNLEDMDEVTLENGVAYGVSACLISKFEHYRVAG